jgi:hypothetical protein
VFVPPIGKDFLPDLILANVAFAYTVKNVGTISYLIGLKRSVEIDKREKVSLYARKL